MNEIEPAFFNSGLVLNYLLRKKSGFTLYLEDGVKLNGTLLGWDSDFLFVKEGTHLQMVPLKKIARLQTELEQIMAVDSAIIQENSGPLPSETPRVNSSPPSPLAKFKPTLAEVKASPVVDDQNNTGGKGDFKDKLDQLVRNW